MGLSLGEERVPVLGPFLIELSSAGIPIIAQEMVAQINAQHPVAIVLRPVHPGPKIFIEESRHVSAENKPRLTIHAEVEIPRLKRYVRKGDRGGGRRGGDGRKTRRHGGYHLRGDGC